MPTFHSIPVHPSVRSRLLRSQQDDNDVCDSGGQESRQHKDQRQQQRRHQPARSIVSIPRSLLTRDLNDLVDMFSRDDVKNDRQRASISAEMETIRYQVACRMISKTRNGKRLACNHQHVLHHSPKRKKRRPLIPAGSMSVLDAWRSQCDVRRKDRNRPEILSTGCSDLDNLVAFPSEYFFAHNDGQDELLPCNVDFVSGEAKGLPQGHLLKLSGTSGKTQLALQLVSQAMIQSSQNSLGKHKRVRYCYSTAGHSGHSLAQRLFQLIENKVGKGEKKILEDVAKKIEFQPIATVSQLTSTIAKLEEEWRGRQEILHHNGGTRVHDTVSMLVLDSLPQMIVEREDVSKIQSLERWLKRLARHYSVLIVIVATTGGGGPSSIYDNAMSPDIHLTLQKRTPTTLSIRLLRHPAKTITQSDCITYTPPK